MLLLAQKVSPLPPFSCHMTSGVLNFDLPFVEKKQICPKVIDISLSVHFKVFLISDETKYQYTSDQNVCELTLD